MDARLSLSVVANWGVASTRNCSGLPNINVPSPTFDAPLGPNVVRWDVRKRERICNLKAHRSLTSCMRSSPDGRYILTASCSKELALWNRQWEKLEDIEAPAQFIHHVAWCESGNRFLLCSKGFRSLVAVYSVTQSATGSPTTTLLWSSCAGCFPSQKKMVSTRTWKGTGDKAGDYVDCDTFQAGEFISRDRLAVIESRHNDWALLHVYNSSNGGLLTSVELVVDGHNKSQPTLISPCCNGVFAVAFSQSSTVKLFDSETIKEKTSFRALSCARTCLWDGDLLLLASDSGRFSWYSGDGILVREICGAPKDTITRLEWDIAHTSLWVCGLTSLHYITIQNLVQEDASESKNQSLVINDSIKFHEVTCCGVDISSDGALVASGDFAGNVMVWSASGGHAPIHTVKVGTSVRCVVWSSVCDVLVGCLDGLCWRWSITGDKQKKVLFALQAGIVQMKWSLSHQHVAAGTTDGTLAVFRVEEKDEFSRPVAVFFAHCPQPDLKDARFGQLDKQAEIWSLCWSPDDSNIATCSEDQTTVIWDTNTWKKIATLAGHSLAVTSVDWKMTSCGSVLATCSDDKTVRLYDGMSFELKAVLDTRDIYGWHTLTYMTLIHDEGQKLGGDCVVCVTQNGYIVVWSLSTLKKVVCLKMHASSIEGLAYSPTSQTLATVGSDCMVALYSITQ